MSKSLPGDEKSGRAIRKADVFDMALASPSLRDTLRAQMANVKAKGSLGKARNMKPGRNDAAPPDVFDTVIAKAKKAAKAAKKKAAPKAKKAKKAAPAVEIGKHHTNVEHKVIFVVSSMTWGNDGFSTLRHVQAFTTENEAHKHASELRSGKHGGRHGKVAGHGNVTVKRVSIALPRRRTLTADRRELPLETIRGWMGGGESDFPRRALRTPPQFSPFAVRV